MLAVVLLLLLAQPMEPDPATSIFDETKPGLSDGTWLDGNLHSVLFVMDSTRRAADHGVVALLTDTALGAFYRSNVAQVDPGPTPVAHKQLTTPTLEALVGDADQNGLFGEVLGGGLDALSVRRPWLTSDPSLAGRLLFSTREDWGGANPSWLSDGEGALDGTVFSLRRSDVNGSPVVERLLTEALLISALGQAGNPGAEVNVDAVALDDAGNIFLSFADEEFVAGMLLGDEGVVCLPRIHLERTAGETSGI